MAFGSSVEFSLDPCHNRSPLGRSNFRCAVHQQSLSIRPDELNLQSRNSFLNGGLSRTSPRLLQISVNQSEELRLGGVGTVEEMNQFLCERCAAEVNCEFAWRAGARARLRAGERPGFGPEFLGVHKAEMAGDDNVRRGDHVPADGADPVAGNARRRFPSDHLRAPERASDDPRQSLFGSCQEARPHRMRRRTEGRSRLT